MTSLGMTLYGTFCGVGYLVVSVFLGVTLVFLFVTLVSMISSAVERYVEQVEHAALAGLGRAH